MTGAWWLNARGRAPPGVFCALFVESRFYGSLYGLLTRFRVLILPRVRFAPVWPSTGRTVSERGEWRVVADLIYVVVAIFPTRGFDISCVRIGERP